MSFNFSSNFLQGVAIVVLCIIVLGGAAIAYPTWRRGRDLKRRDAELALSIERKKAEIVQLMEYQRRFKTDPGFVESIARRNRRVFPGEYVFIFDD